MYEGRRLVIFTKIMSRVRMVHRGYRELDENGEWVYSACYEWQGPTSGKGRGGGYPRMSLDGQTVAVHIAMFVNKHGFVPGKKQVDHKCENRLCVRLAHLQMVTHKKNQRLKKVRKNK